MYANPFQSSPSEPFTEVPGLFESAGFDLISLLTSVTDHQSGVEASASERRRAPRFRFDVIMPAVLGRGDALLLDISREGARVTHFETQPLGRAVRLILFYRGRGFYVTARVLASWVKGLGTGPSGSATYESRLRFIDCSLDAAETLEEIIAQIQRERREQRTSNARHAMHPAHGSDGPGYFITCRLQGRRWARSWSRDSAQPADGFTVPAMVGEEEVAMLCSTYEKMDRRGRDLVRTTAEIAGLRV